MATANPQGIMALPAGGAPANTGAPAQPQLGLDDSYDAVQQGLQNASPQASDAVNAELNKLTPMMDQMPDELIDQLLQIIQYMHDNPKEYAKCVQKLIETGLVQEGDFPEEYDPEFLATIGLALMHAKQSRQGSQGAAPMAQAPVPPPGMARGGIAEAAHMVASRGRGKDTMLAHITPREAKMLRAKGGMGTINPATGLPEYGWLSDAWDGITGAVEDLGNTAKDAWNGLTDGVKDVFNSPIGRVLGTVALAAFIGPGAFGLTGAAGAAAQMALASGAATALGGGNIKDILKSAAIGGATAFFGAPGGVISNFVGGAVTNAAANAAITSGIVGTGIGLLSGQKLQDAVKSGLTAGAISGLSTGATKGFGAQIEAPKVPTVGEMADQNRPTAQQIEANVKPTGATSDAVRGFGEVQGSPLPPADASSYMQPAGTDGLTPLMDPATGGIQTVAADNNTVYELYKRSDGTTMFRPTTGSGADAPAFMKGDVVGRMTDNQLSSMSPQGAGAGPSSSYTGRTSMGPAYDTGFGPGADVSAPSAGTVGGRFDGVSPVEALPPPVEGPYNPPTFGRAYDELSRGEYGNAAKTVFMPEAPTAEQVHGSEAFQNARAAGADYSTAYQKAADQMGAPGIIRTYGPATAAGLGIAGLAGAFTPKKPQPSPEEQAMNARLQAERDRVAANPGAYVPQGLEKYGIKYNERGEIIGSQPWNPAPAPGTTEVAGNYMPYTPSPYMSPTGAIGGGQPIYQPFNTDSMYTNLMPPQYRAGGGMMFNETIPDSVLRDGGPVHMALGGDLGNLVSGKFLSSVSPAVKRAIAQQDQQVQQQQQAAAQAARVAEIQNSYRPPVQPMQPPVQQPVEVTNYPQSYDPNQVSELSRRLYPSIYDQSFRDSILSNTAMGQQRGGGIASLATGGYPRRTGQISGPGTETSDSIPAMLSDGEFVMTAKAVRGAGKGNRLAGAKKMYALMHQLERNAARG